MKKYLASLMLMGFVLSPIIALADVSFSPDLKTIGCFDVTSGTVTVTGSQAAIALSVGTHTIDFVHWNEGGTLDFTAPPDSGSLSLPTTFNYYHYYDSGWSYDHALTAPLTLQDTSCGGGGDPEATTTTATSTIAVGGIEFGLAIIIVLLSLMFIGFVWNRTITKRKKWQK